MCGICGIINYSTGLNNFEDDLRKMMAKISHRGPDDSGTFTHSNTYLGHQRLSIIDLSQAGHQPMLSDDGRFAIVYNGEIYNYKELRNKLEGIFTFTSKTDTEVLLKSYQYWGKECLQHLNGMFAFAIYDKVTEELFLARDRFGIKPLYFYSDGERFLFASEIKAIITVLGYKPSANYKAINDYLVFNRTDVDDHTFFKNINKLRHGSYLIHSNQDYLIKRWYDLKDNIGKPFNSSEEFRNSLLSSVKLQLRSDVPVGVCLSGGVDSSSILSIILKDLGKTDINTFSAVYKGFEFDEYKYIRSYKSLVNNMNFIEPSYSSFFDDLPSFIKSHEEPISTTSPYAQYKVMELASKKVGVTLDGQGADEQLAGYHYFFGFYFAELLRGGRFKDLITQLSSYVKETGESSGLKTFFYSLLPNLFDRKLNYLRANGIRRDFFEEYIDQSVFVREFYKARDLQESLLLHFEYKLEHLLKWSDKNSMHFSLESRVPFLDHNLVERSVATHSNKIINNGVTKCILRDAVKDIVPEIILQRTDKIGFKTPQDDWFREPKFKDFILSIITSDSFKNRGIFDQKNVMRLYKLHMNNKRNISKDLWKWVNLEIWFREYID